MLDLIDVLASRHEARPVTCLAPLGAARERGRNSRGRAISFFALATYVSIDAARALTGTGEAATSVPGIVIAALSLAIMPFLSAAQRKAGRELGSASAAADSKQTLLCTYLSVVLLVGLVLNATFGWFWADPIAAIAVREGVNAWQGKGCCARTRPALQHYRDRRVPERVRHGWRHLLFHAQGRRDQLIALSG
ncbi:cation transporter [Streptomyces sp. NPDC056361]|uniref:cation transporter n=1 Tax=Streptomyces sp. NPDC056361 TaxID=3345795 RepID=UPI0035D98D93